MRRNIPADIRTENGEIIGRTLLTSGQIRSMEAGNEVIHDGQRLFIRFDEGRRFVFEKKVRAA